MTPEQMQELTKRIVDEFNTGELVLGHDDNYYIKGTTEDLESAVRLALTEVRNEAIKECERCVPEEEKEDYDGFVPRYRNGQDMWGEDYANRNNYGVRKHNICRNQTLQAINKLRV